MRKFLVICLFQFMACGFILAQDIKNNPGSNHANKFEQLGTILPTPNEYRTASGAPGNKYWQQRADYDIKAELDEKALNLQEAKQLLIIITHQIHLAYLWLQLDENEHSTIKNAGYQNSNPMPRQISAQALEKSGRCKKDNGFGVNI